MSVDPHLPLYLGSSRARVLQAVSVSLPLLSVDGRSPKAWGFLRSCRQGAGRRPDRPELWVQHLLNLPACSWAPALEG